MELARVASLSRGQAFFARSAGVPPNDTKISVHFPEPDGNDAPAPRCSTQVPPGTECKAVTGRLIHVQIKKDHNYIDLWLFTTLPPRVRHRRQKFPPLKGSRTDARARDTETKSV
jgi:hypothetical protein